MSSQKRPSQYELLLHSTTFILLHAQSWNLPVLQDTDEGRNKSNDNPAKSAQGAKPSSGECIRTRMTSMAIDTTNNSNQDKVLRSTHTETTSSH